jgi:hypothetical protein
MTDSLSLPSVEQNGLVNTWVMGSGQSKQKKGEWVWGNGKYSKIRLPLEPVPTMFEAGAD